MWKRALTAGLFVGIGVGVAGTLALQGREPEPRPIPQAQSYATAGELMQAMRASGVTCTPLTTGKYPGCKLPDGGPNLTVRATFDGWFTGGLPVAPALVGPNWVVSADESDAGYVLAQVQRGLGGELRTVPGVPAGPARVIYPEMGHERD